MFEDIPITSFWQVFNTQSQEIFDHFLKEPWKTTLREKIEAAAQRCS